MVFTIQSASHTAVILKSRSSRSPVSSNDRPDVLHIPWIRTRDLTGGTGATIGQYTCDAFGAIRSQTGLSTNYWQFTGEQRDASEGLYYLRARYYDPATGRFAGRDPLAGFSRLPQTQDRYPYVGSHPVNRVDPTGLVWTVARALAAINRQQTRLQGPAAGA